MEIFKDVNEEFGIENLALGIAVADSTRAHLCGRSELGISFSLSLPLMSISR